MSDGKIVYDVDVNDDGVESKVRSTNDKISSAADQGSSAFSEVWTGALRTIGGKLVELGQMAVETAVDVAKESLAQVASFEQNVGGIEKLFGESANTVMENANKAFKTAGLSSNEYMESVTGFSAALINSLGGDTEQAAKLADVAIRSMSDNANTFGTDMQSIMNTYQGLAKENYTMVDNLKLGYAGTKEGMKKLIEDASKMTDVQKELGLTVDGTSMDFANCVKAIEVMQASMNIAGTTSREAAGTIEGSVSSLKAAWDNFLTGTIEPEEFASTAVVAATNIINAFKEILPRLAEGFAEMVPVLLDFVIDLGKQLGQAIMEQGPGLAERGLELIGKLGEGLSTGIPEFLAKAEPMLVDFLGKLRENSGKFIDTGLDFIVKLIQGLVNSLPQLAKMAGDLIEHMVKHMVTNLPKILETGVKILGILVQGVKDALPALKDTFLRIVDLVVEIWKSINWSEVGQNVINKIKEGVQYLSEKVPELLKSIANKGVELFKSIDWKDVGYKVMTFILNGIKLMYYDIPNKLWEIGKNAIDKMKDIDWMEVGTNIVEGIEEGLTNAMSMLVDAAVNVVSGAVDAVKDFLGIASPSKVYKLVGKYSVEGEAEGMIDNADLVEDASREVAKRAVEAQMDVDYTLPDIDSASRDMSASLSSSFMSTVTRIIEIPLNIDAREVARATAWDMGEQLAWEMR